MPVIWMQWDGINVILEEKPRRWVRNNRMHGVCMTCTEMFGNGVRIGTVQVMINTGLAVIQKAHCQAHIACYEVAVGTAMPSIAVLQTGTTTTRTFAATISGSASWEADRESASWPYSMSSTIFGHRGASPDFSQDID